MGKSRGKAELPTDSKKLLPPEDTDSGRRGLQGADLDHGLVEMVKAKLRLGLAVAGVVLGTIILIKLATSGHSKYSYYDEYSISGQGQGIQLRKLNQPFNWHKDSEEESDGKDDGIEGEGGEGGEGGGQHGSNKTVKFCRNSVQGKMLIADDTGRVCHRNDLLQNGCCHENSTSTHHYNCEGCHEASGCCKVYEHCISCCMDPKKKPVLMKVLNEANALKNILLLSVSDHFELCLAKCRTSSSSVRHENVYINPENKYCFMRGNGHPPPSPNDREKPNKAVEHKASETPAKNKVEKVEKVEKKEEPKVEEEVEAPVEEP